MARAPSAETENRRLRSDLKAARGDAEVQRRKAENYHFRLIEAQKELEEWKRRFDALLKIVPANEP